MDKQDKKKTSRKPNLRMPSTQEVLEFIQSCAVAPLKREIAQALGLKGQAPRVELKRILAELTASGLYKKARTKDQLLRGIFKVSAIDDEGRILARLHKADTNKVDMDGWGEFAVQTSRTFASLDRLEVAGLFYGEAADEKTVRPIRLFHKQAENPLLRGVVSRAEDRWIFLPASREHRFPFMIQGKDADIEPLLGHYVTARLSAQKKEAVVLHDDLGPLKNISDFVIARYDFPKEFSAEAVKIANAATVPALGDRTDIRDLPLVTIDGKDAKDFDDAVFATPDQDPKNKGGYHLIVAIADVATYVEENSALDREAYKRGNSTYLPDQVLPMLPEALSNGLCSLRPDEDRACLGVNMWIDASGKLLRHKFFQGLMRSHARLTYEEVEQLFQKKELDRPAAIQSALGNLLNAYGALLKARAKRDPLAIHSPELSVEFGAHGEVTHIQNAKSLESHQLIEEFMVLANRAAAMMLKQKKIPLVSRIHDAPPMEKVMNFKEFLRGHKVSIQGHFQKSTDFNQLTQSLKDSPISPMLQEMVLRSQSKAVYSSEQQGHFGLNLSDYCHFTSPIRRYADLLVHRGLVEMLGNAPASPKDTKSLQKLEEKCQHISERERESVSAERETLDRFATYYFQSKIGERRKGYISGIGRAGLFVSLKEVNISGLIPMEALGDDYYVELTKPLRLEGRRTKRVFNLGDELEVTIAEADVAKGRLAFSLGDTPFKKRSFAGSKKSFNKPRGKPGEKFKGKPKGNPKGHTSDKTSRSKSPRD